MDEVPTMGEWILILTIVAGGYSAPAITQAGPFDTRALCLKAGSAWLKQRGAYNLRSKDALCVQRSYSSASGDASK
jgi:hypothetical protein